MKIRTILLATALVASSSAAFAQAGGNNDGAAMPERSGAAMTRGVPPAGTLDDHGRRIDREPGETTGMTRGGPSGPGDEPGQRDKSRVGGEGVNDRPSD
jgi:hypothetical protein